MGHAIAQTNLQLFRQAREAGYADESILTLRRDCETVNFLCGDLLRHSGKPFVSHLVGTASVLMHEKQPLPMVRTGLHHAAYDHGRFSTGRHGETAMHRQWLRARVGEDVETIVRAYGDFVYTPERVISLAQSPEPVLSGTGRDMMILRLCNEVDDSLDYAAALQGDPRWRDTAYFEALLKLCDLIGLEFCAMAFERVAREMQDAQWLTPVERMAYVSHRPSIFSYGKATAKAWGKILLGRKTMP